MSRDGMPIVVLAGSDRRPVEMPTAGRDKHPLSGYKGIDLRIGGLPLIERVIERLHACGRFGAVYVVGPMSVFGYLKDAQVIDADRSFGRNVEIALDTVRRAHPDLPVGFVTCDILPDVDTIQALMDDYDRHRPCDLWFPMIHAPEDRGCLGASAWKPGYSIVPEEGHPAVDILPGHLAIVDPAALRIKFVMRLLQLGYSTRNRSINYRRTVMVRGVLFALLYQDLLHLFGLRAPTLTWSVVSVGVAAARDLRNGTITRTRLEDALRKIFMTARHRKRFPERRVRLPIVEGLSLAMDIDTEEEARAAGADVSVRLA